MSSDAKEISGILSGDESTRRGERKISEIVRNF